MRKYSIVQDRGFNPTCKHNSESWAKLLKLFSRHGMNRRLSENLLVSAVLNHMPPPSRRMESKKDNALAFVNYLTREIGILRLEITNAI